ncbi:MAG: histidine kinase [Lachnospiraceae bacterium]|nr:histidine kinase [Lachnospiraceae bacterium]
MKKKIYLVKRTQIALTALFILAAVMDLVVWLRAGEDTVLHMAAICSAVLLAAAAYYVLFEILRPYIQLKKMYRLLADGYFMEKLYEYGIQFDGQVEMAQKKLMERMSESDILSLSKKQAEYLALQNQINPHFLYNILEGIRSEALLAGMDSVAEMTEALATFFRYTISKVDHLVTLEDELANIENYYVIQQYRFGDRLSLSIEYEDDDEMEALSCLIPKLTLQPIVENSIYHGLEEKIGKGHLRIRIALTRQRLLITISDDGVGMAPDMLDKLNRKMTTALMEDLKTNSEKRGGIAVINVNNRIKLLFGEEYGLYFYSTPGLGTDVEITLPVRTRGQEREEHERRSASDGARNDG